jgi:glyoxylase-like metal-dependent hydrolase (beta-lactamase superfamily II)/rhodanese-related sulfurtransferase
MYIKQLYTNCLSEAAYYIESNGEAAIIDPLRDIEEYILMAKERKATIKYIFETHFHADFVSGHIDLSNATGAPIIYGPGAKTNFKIENAADGQTYKLGSLTLNAIHTPGHTLESTCYLLMDEKSKPHAIFTGDTLFVNDVGRPDLSSGDMSSEELAGIMYDTLTTKILPLPDDVIVYPAHGPGSSCGKNLGPNTFSTIADERRNNHALQPQSKEDFITSVTTGLRTAPVYFAVNASINQKGYEAIDVVKTRGIQTLSIEQFKQLAKEDAVILDTRPATEFTESFIPGSLFIGLEGRFAEWAGSLLPFDKKIILITPAGKEEETVIRLARVGFDKMNGVLSGGFEAWRNAGEKTDMIIDVEPDELMMDIPHDPNLVIVDVRTEIEHADGHLKGSVNLPLSDMTDVALLAQFEEEENLYVHCAGGYRSVIAISILKKEGINNVRNILGGWAKIKEEEKAVIEKDASVLN